ncbi:hypothetical protein ACFQZQ_03060 [Lysobacter koreensis]|uniref:Uncharacterized protein n=1 Tax=Lysobacter koreensis TaxID=266122 RepID=A0ABW2YJV9_9GAMM
MSRKPAPSDPSQWRTLNPHYEGAPSRTYRMRCADGVVREVVEQDGGVVFDADQLGRKP